MSTPADHVLIYYAWEPGPRSYSLQKAEEEVAWLDSHGFFVMMGASMAGVTRIRSWDEYRAGQRILVLVSASEQDHQLSIWAKRMAIPPYPEMGPSRGADRPSLLAINPGNEQASAKRRAKLLAAFDQLTIDQRADLLELAETVSHAAGDARLERNDLRDLVRGIYTIAGWEE